MTNTAARMITDPNGELWLVYRHRDGTTRRERINECRPPAPDDGDDLPPDAIF